MKKEIRFAFNLEDVYVEIAVDGEIEVRGETGKHLFTIHRRDRDMVSVLVELCQTLHNN